MEKRLTFVLSSSPYAGQTAKDQKATAVFDVGGAAEAFLARGGAVDL